MLQKWGQKGSRIRKVPQIAIYRTFELLLLDTLDEEWYAVWRPKLQEKKLSFESVEEELGFRIHPQIKQFFNTYYFRTLDGKIMSDEGKVSFSLNNILPSMDLANILKHSVSDSETHYIRNKVFFLIGSYAKINGNDSYLIHVNNETCEVTAVEVGERHSVKLADSIEDLLMNMKGIWSECIYCFFSSHRNSSENQNY